MFCETRYVQGAEMLFCFGLSLPDVDGRINFCKKKSRINFMFKRQFVNVPEIIYLISVTIEIYRTCRFQCDAFRTYLLSTSRVIIGYTLCALSYRRLDSRCCQGRVARGLRRGPQTNR